MNPVMSAVKPPEVDRKPKKRGPYKKRPKIDSEAKALAAKKKHALKKKEWR